MLLHAHVNYNRGNLLIDSFTEYDAKILGSWVLIIFLGLYFRNNRLYIDFLTVLAASYTCTLKKRRLTPDSSVKRAVWKSLGYQQSIDGGKDMCALTS